MRAMLAIAVLLTLSGCEAPEIGKAKEAIRSGLKDPASAVFTHVAAHDGTVCGEVNSKNGFGAMAGAVPFFVTKDGKASIAPPVPDIGADRLNEMRNACYSGPGDGFSYACQSYRTAYAESDKFMSWMTERERLCGPMPKP
jgi:hypothetical protein